MKYILGKDLIPKDNLLDGFTFEEVIDSLVCNEPDISEATVMRVINNMLQENIENMNALVKNNLPEIIKRVIESRDDS